MIISAVLTVMAVVSVVMFLTGAIVVMKREMK